MTVTAAAAVRAVKGWATCPTCGWPIDPAGAAGTDGTPNVFNQHAACEQRPQLRAVKGGKV